MTMAMATTVSASPIASVIAAATLTMALTVVRDVLLVIPVFLDEIDRTSAGVVLIAVLVPMLLVPRGDIEIDRLYYGGSGHGLNDHRLGLDQLGARCVADINLSVESWLAYVDGDADIDTSECWYSSRR